MPEFRDTARILDLARAGRPPREISALTGCPRSRIYDVLRRARDAGDTIPRFSRGKSFQGHKSYVWLPAGLVERLRLAGAGRGLSGNDLARQILHRTVEDDLIDAILDDGEGADA